MRIAIFSPSKNPYSETFIQAHKNYLKDKVFYYYGHNNIKLEGEATLGSKLQILKYRVLGKLQNKHSQYVKEQLLLNSLRQNNIEVILVEYGTHAYTLLPLLKASKIPFVVHFHGYDASVNTVIEKCGNYQEVFKSTSKVIAVSQVMYSTLLNLGCPKHKLVYNVYGPQVEFEKVIPKFTKNQFIAIGRFTDKKAPYYTLLAFKEVLKQYPEAKLLMAGQGDLYNTCENLIQYYNLQDNVSLLGVITPDVYRNLLAESLAFVQHSITAKNGDKEGTPLAVLEASVSGLPVISTYHAGIPDVILHNTTGLLSNEHDVKSMSNHMLKLLADKELAKQMGAAGKAHILNNFTLKRHINVLQEILESSIK